MSAHAQSKEQHDRDTLSLYFHVTGYRPLQQIRFIIISLLIWNEHSQCLCTEPLTPLLINPNK